MAASPDPARPDARGWSRETKGAIRRLAVGAVARGEKPSAVARRHGICRTTIYRWLQVERTQGAVGLRGHRHPGRPPRLGREHDARIRDWIVGRTPRDHGLASELWNREALSALVERELGVRIGVLAAARLMRRLRLHPRVAFLPPERTAGLPGVTVFAVDGRGCFLCEGVEGPVAVDDVRRTWARLAEIAGRPVVCGCATT